MKKMPIPFVDLKTQYQEIKHELRHIEDKIFKRSDFILGEEEKFFEQEFARYVGTKFGIGVNSGTDALFLSLLSLGIGRGDEVIVPVFTFIATALAVSFTGAKPVFVDIDEKTYNIDVNKIEKAITKRTKVIIPVHLYGQCADMGSILKIADKHGLKIVEDAAQAHGAEYFNPQPKKVGSIGDIGCFSFYPTKNLGACGDAGMVVTNSKKIYERLLMLRDCGRTSRYEHAIIGYNSRLDTLQAAILRLKLKKLDSWNKSRRSNAALYTELLKDSDGIITPYEASYGKHIYHIYALRLNNRDKIYHNLRRRGIGVFIHYPIPLHLQKAYRHLGYKNGNFPVAEKIAKQIISLPMHPHLKRTQIEYVAEALKELI